MLLKAGVVSLALLLASRLLGLLRESAQAAAFGTTGLADLAVLMLSLPDWVAGVLASGALAYVLVPAWAGKTSRAVAASQRRVARGLWVLGIGLGLLALLALWQAPQAVLSLLAPGLPEALAASAARGLAWSAIALPLALLAGLGSARLQHEGDPAGLYGANLVVNGALVAAIAAAGWTLVAAGLGVDGAVAALGLGLLAAMGLRRGWQAWREARLARRRAASGAEGLAQADPRELPSADFQLSTTDDKQRLDTARDARAGEGVDGEPLRLPTPSVWAWAILAAGLPLALPFAARSLASGQGEGALAAFNYAWKLVELPLMLAIQLVATLAFPRVAAAVAGGLERPEARTPLQAAFGLAFVLACAAAAGLLVAADAVARLLFGWGRMGPEGLAQVASWGRVGAWGLLPQAVSAVGLTVLASQKRLRPAAAWHALALSGLLVAGLSLPRDGGTLMAAVNAVSVVVALGVLASMGRVARALLPWRAMAVSLAVLVVVALGAPLLDATAPSLVLRLLVAVLAAFAVVAAVWFAGGGWGRTLRR